MAASAPPQPPPPLSPSSQPPPKPSSIPHEPSLDSVPDDVALGVAALLGPGDLCSLESCSRFWRGLCSTDCLWAVLSVRRWPSVGTLSPQSLVGRPWPSLGSPAPRSLVDEGEGSSSDSASADRTPSFAFRPPAQGWKSFYISCHQEMAARVTKVIKFVKQCTQNDSLEVGDYLKALAALHTLDLGYDDVKFFLLTVKHSVLLNLIGLHYMIFYLRIPVVANAESLIWWVEGWIAISRAQDIKVIRALRSSDVSGRQVCVKWFKLGRWFYGFRLPDESLYRRISLMEFATSDKEVRNILNRGAIHEVLRVQIIPVIPGTS
ncbi:hypothetical protein Taro_052038 [Colocasia esculenta]|uniref:F-box domain-containing protein n=1 Tax=Colocasia esculenta TaxID=4460 RepID=A0A843XHK5_COLES|nr:hypothetical protein [Colocasia esculenta]